MYSTQLPSNSCEMGQFSWKALCIPFAVWMIKRSQQNYWMQLSVNTRIYLGHLWVVKHYNKSWVQSNIHILISFAKRKSLYRYKEIGFAVGVNNVMVLRTVAWLPRGNSTRPATYHCDTSSHQQSNGINGEMSHYNALFSHIILLRYQTGEIPLIARLMGPTWGPSVADRT